MSNVLQVEYVGDLAPYDYEAAELAKAGAQLTVARGKTAADILEAAAEADVIWLEWTPHLTGDVLARLPRCRLVLRWGVGYEQIDVAAATELGIAVGNAPTYCTIDVAEHALALLLSVSRQIVARHEQLRQGLWRSGPTAPRRLSGSTVGVVGLGRIGRRMAALCAATGARVIGYDPATGQIPGVENVGLDELLARADYVTLHVPLMAQTRHLIRAGTLALMKQDAVLINTSRGAIVHQDDLVQALSAGRIAGAALDVFEDEPLPADHPVRALPSVVLTPHEAALSPAAVSDLRREICRATTDFLRTGWADSIVNPQVRDHLRVPTGRA
ncbi:MAG TPA: C-terminal binding protein [Streptosporangiaceae bacterium]|nr:C-terminal binding protein [Streptosporangiaceae bacterium]